MRRFVLFGPSILVLLVVAVTLVAGPAAIHRLSAAQTAARVTLAQDRLDADNILERINQSVRDVADAVEPSVVYIETRGEFGRGGYRSNGSGWVYDNLGHIVTNSHVIGAADDITVQFYDGRSLQAEPVGVDPSTDIAVVRVNLPADQLFPARRASGVHVHQGDTVFAFGSPFNYKFSMSQGIVSGLGRHARASGTTSYTNFIQTDAAVNPGNSGGPLVDVNARIIGMNTAIIAAEDRIEDATRTVTGVSGGIGFAIPLDTIEAVVDQLIRDGEVRKGYLGVQLAEIDDRNARRFGIPRMDGVLVDVVVPGQPASIAGLESGDIITGVDDDLTPTLAVLRSTIGHRPPGDVVTLQIIRGGEALDIPVRLGAARFDPNRGPVPIIGDDTGN
ncbi:MAG: trypsin-like peptidase domain-containing protein [Planctomycetota bacterium]|nr:trypsin-like peptidase domain-containing protein [Planctomycetota bacterium]